MIMININGESIADVQKMMAYVFKSLETSAGQDLCYDNDAPLSITVSQFPPFPAMPFYSPSPAGFGDGPSET